MRESYLSRGYNNRDPSTHASTSKTPRATNMGKNKIFKNNIRNRFEEFLSSGETELRLEPMSSEQRWLVHIIARKMDLRSVSHGKEPDRYMIIKRGAPRVTHYIACKTVNDTPSVQLCDYQMRIITDFLREFPVEHAHVDEHFAVPKKKSNKPTFTATRAKKLIPPPRNYRREMERFRAALPTASMRDEILRTIDAYKVTIVTGGTGCGKTTQVPQFILEEAYRSDTPLRIYCTQPRRLPAIAVAKRVAQERGERLGDAVGYHIRLEQRTGPDTVLVYCTSGVLLRMLTADELANYMTHIILDEVHEREQNTDYLLIALRQALRKRDNLKVILMSATMEGNMATFLNYFDGTPVGHVNISSRLYNVEKFDLADVLALTGYMPQSTFGGMFGIPSLASTAYDSFPPVGQFRSEEHIVDAGGSGGGGFDSIGMFQLADENIPSSGLHSIQTEPDLYHWHSNNPSSSSAASSIANNSAASIKQYHIRGGFRGFRLKKDSSSTFGDCGSSSFVNYGFGKNSDGWSYRTSDDVHCHLNRVLPYRPNVFQPDYVTCLRRARDLDRNSLISTYMSLGGQQWSDGVDVDLIVALIHYLTLSPADGAILVFLPGFEDIMQVRDRISDQLKDLLQHMQIFVLHSQVNSNEQQYVFDRLPKGIRKIILSTNIAEASLTIDDVIFVIDCGKVKEKTYDHTTRITQLKVSWIAKSNAEQRAGRAGRCRNGYCFRLYSQYDYDMMPDAQLPEMKRAAIHDICLHAKMFAPERLSVNAFLQMAPDPPPPLAVEHSMQFLEQLGALYTDKERVEAHRQRNADNPEQSKFARRSFGYGCDTATLRRCDIPAAEFFAMTSDNASALTIGVESELTELGRVLAHLPLEPQLSRLLLFGVALRCFNPVVTLVATLSHRDPFVLPLGDDRTAAINARDEFARGDFSDHLMFVRAFYAYCRYANNSGIYRFCREKFLNLQAMKMIHGIRKQLVLELRRLRLLPASMTSHEDPRFNTYSDCWPMVQGAIVAGCYPGIGFVKAGSKLRKIRTSSDANASLHPSSAIRRQVTNASKRMKCEPIVEYLAFQELAKINEGLTIRMVTVVPPLSVLFFAGPIRISKEVAENFEIAEEDIPPEVLRKPKRSDNDRNGNGVYKKLYESSSKNYNDDWRGHNNSSTSGQRLPYEKNRFLRKSVLSGECRNGNQTTSNNSTTNDKLIEGAISRNGTSFKARHNRNCLEKAEGANDDNFRQDSTSTSIVVEEDGDWCAGTARATSSSAGTPTRRVPGAGTIAENLLKWNNVSENNGLSAIGPEKNKVDRQIEEWQLKFLGTEQSEEKILDQLLSGQLAQVFTTEADDEIGCQKKAPLADANLMGDTYFSKGGVGSGTESKTKGNTENSRDQQDASSAPDEENDNDNDETDFEGAFETDEPEPEYVLELATWLAFKGPFTTMQALVRLRFKLMSYFLAVLRNPTREATIEDQNLLKCLSEVLSQDHRSRNFPSCFDLPRPSSRSSTFDDSYEDVVAPTSSLAAHRAPTRSVNECNNND